MPPTQASEHDATDRARLSAEEIAAALAEAQAFGVDLEALRHNLRLTPARRLAMLQAGLRTWRALRNARPV